MELSITRRHTQKSSKAAAVHELIEARKALEVANAAIAADKRTDEDLKRLEDILNQMKEISDQAAEIRKSDAEFHQVIAQCTHNPILIELVETVSERLDAALRDTKRSVLFAYKPLAEQIWREHKEIYQAIREQNGYLAQEKMKQHMFHVERVLLRFSVK
jgi:GntR family transcriptional regulator, transcriptional repressor for pyruvate dehydrogenase complex